MLILFVDLLVTYLYDYNIYLQTLKANAYSLSISHNAYSLLNPTLVAPTHDSRDLLV